MIAKQSVYLNLERDKAFPEGDENARLLLVRAGQEVEQAELDRYEGAADLADTEPEVKEQPVIPPPNLKVHGDESADGRIPEPTIKGVDKQKKEESAAAPTKSAARPRGKKPRK